MVATVTTSGSDDDEDEDEGIAFVVFNVTSSPNPARAEPVRLGCGQTLFDGVLASLLSTRAEKRRDASEARCKSRRVEKKRAVPRR